MNGCSVFVAHVLHALLELRTTLHTCKTQCLDNRKKSLHLPYPNLGKIATKMSGNRAVCVGAQFEYVL
jgi:hypothetical protein